MMTEAFIVLNHSNINVGDYGSNVDSLKALKADS